MNIYIIINEFVCANENEKKESRIYSRRNQYFNSMSGLLHYYANQSKLASTTPLELDVFKVKINEKQSIEEFFHFTDSSRDQFYLNIDECKSGKIFKLNPEQLKKFVSAIQSKSPAAAAYLSEELSTTYFSNKQNAATALKKNVVNNITFKGLAAAKARDKKTLIEQATNDYAFAIKLLGSENLRESLNPIELLSIYHAHRTNNAFLGRIDDLDENIHVETLLTKADQHHADYKMYSISPSLAKIRQTQSGAKDAKAKRDQEEEQREQAKRKQANDEQIFRNDIRNFDNEQRNAFTVLGLNPNCATTQQIRPAYLKIALLNHPDKNEGAPDAEVKKKREEEVKKQIKAYKILETEEGRRHFRSKK